MPTWPSPRSERLGTPNSPAIRFARGTYFEASWFTHLLRPVRLLAPLYGSDWNAQPTGASTSRLSTDRSPSPLLDMTTTATGLLCWRDFHPLEWQLASLHQTRMCRFPASGSSWESLAHGGADDTIRDLPAVRFLVPVSDHFKPLPARCKGRCKLWLHCHLGFFECSPVGVVLNIVSPHYFKPLPCWCGQFIKQRE